MPHPMMCCIILSDWTTVCTIYILKLFYNVLINQFSLKHITELFGGCSATIINSTKV